MISGLKVGAWYSKRISKPFGLDNLSVVYFHGTIAHGQIGYFSDKDSGHSPVSTI